MITQTSEIYARSLLEFDFDVLKQLNQIKEVFALSPDLYALLTNPSVKISDKTDISEAVFKEKIDERLINFLKILCENGRIDEFNQIISAYEKELDKKNNIKSVKIVSAIELTDDYKQKIQKKLEQKLNASIHPQWFVDGEIIGGLIFKYEDTIIDSSLKNKIENFGKTMK